MRRNINSRKNSKTFSSENTVLNKKFNNRKLDIWFKNHNLIIEVDEGNHESYDSGDEKEREDMFKNHNFKNFRWNPNDPNFYIFKFLSEINLYVSKLRKKMHKIKGIIKWLIKLLKTLKIKIIKTICRKHFTKLQQMKNTKSKIKPIKIGKRPETMYCFGCKDYTQNFRLQEVKMTNKVLREKSHCVVCRSNKLRFLKEEIN